MDGNKLRQFVGLVMILCPHWTLANAGVLLGGTRVILGEKDREASISTRNTGTTPFVMQTWVDGGEGKNKTPFIVIPPLSRLDPGKENILRILRAPSNLPSDRESAFWLNVKEIPEKSAEEGVLQVAVHTRIKLLYRPAGLAGRSSEAKEQLQWAVGTDGKGVAMLKLANPTPYHISLTTLRIDGGQQEIDADMIRPFGELTYRLTALGQPQEVRVVFSTINDYGGETAKEKVLVPVADKPVALRAETVPPLGGDSK